MRRRTLLAASAVSLTGTPLAAFAQAPYPTRPVRLIAPFPPGGTSDVLGRLLAQKMSDGLGQPVTVENRPGAAANIGHELAARAPVKDESRICATQCSRLRESGASIAG